MAVTYRLAEVRDADELAVLHLAAWRAAYAGLIDQQALDGLEPTARAEVFRQALPADVQQARGMTWIVAEEDGVLVGHAQSHRVDGLDGVDEEGVLELLYLKPDVIGTGTGHALHEMMMRAMHRQGARVAKLVVLDGNDSAIRFYERHGWELSGEPTQDEWSGIAVTHREMRRDLSVDVLQANRGYWNAKAPQYSELQTWNPEVAWGIFQISDEEAGSIFPDVAGCDVVELGCGTAYVSNWAVQHGARSAVGIDNSPEQLATAQQRSAERGLDLPVLLGDAHTLPFADNSFDVAINEYGAAIWCDPRVWIPEAARVLRPGGLLWSLGNSVQAMLCLPEFEEQFATGRLLRPQRAMHRFEWLDTPNIEFHVSHGEMISILTSAGFVVEALHELYPPPDADNDYGMLTAEWAGKWPAEEVWVARLA